MKLHLLTVSYAFIMMKLHLLTVSYALNTWWNKHSATIAQVLMLIWYDLIVKSQWITVWYDLMMKLHMMKLHLLTVSYDQRLLNVFTASCCNCKLHRMLPGLYGGINRCLRISHTLFLGRWISRSLGSPHLTVHKCAGRTRACVHARWGICVHAQVLVAFQEARRGAGCVSSMHTRMS